MARQVANVDILTDTFNTWVLRTNEIIDVLNTDIITANSTLGVTGSLASPRNALLYGSFTANNILGDTLTLGQNFIANTSAILIGSNLKLIANGTPGSAGQLLATDGNRVFWSTAAGTGTVTQLANGAGVFFTDLPSGQFGSPITSYGTIRIRAGDGIVVDSRGISVNTAYLAASVTNASTLQSRTWEASGAIGTSTPNTGIFSTVTSGQTTGFRLQNDPVFLISNSVIRTQGYADVTTPNLGSTGGLRVRGNPTSGVAYIPVTDSNGSTEWGNFKAHSNGYIVWSGAIAGSNYPNLIPSGTVMLFAQTNAPLGWTKLATHDNKALRVVSGAASSGGTRSFTSAFNASFTSDGTTLNINQIPAHTHTTKDYIIDAVDDGGSAPQAVKYTGTSTTTGSAGGSQPHTHTMNFDVQYVDVILASKN